MGRCTVRHVLFFREENGSKGEGVGLEELKCPEGSEETLLASPAGGAYEGHAAGGLGAAWVGSALSLEEAGRGWGAVSPGPWA